MVEGDRSMRGGLRHHAVARAHGIFNIASGLWPLVSMGSFEAVSGPKYDKWLVRTVSGLLLTIGWSQVRGAQAPSSARTARSLGLGTALTMMCIDLTYAPTGRIAKTYLLDAVVEAGWVAAWVASSGSRPAHQGGGAAS